MSRSRYLCSLVVPTAALLGVGLVSLTQGCARSHASRWAQMAPAIRPVPAGESIVALSAAPAPVADAEKDAEPADSTDGE